jgi:gas vesicle structural protein
LTVDLRVVIASVDTYLRFAEAVNRLDLRATDDSWSLGRIGEEEEELAESAGKGAVEGGIEGVEEKVTPGRRRRDND